MWSGPAAIAIAVLIEGTSQRRRHDGVRRRSTDLSEGVEAPADHGAADAHRARVLAPGRYRDRVPEPLHGHRRGLEPVADEPAGVGIVAELSERVATPAPHAAGDAQRAREVLPGGDRGDVGEAAHQALRGIGHVG